MGLDGGVLASAGAVLLAGWLIGATGIGGVLVVPALVSLQGMPAAQAIAASALAFAFPGIAALVAMRRGAGTEAAAGPALPWLPLLVGSALGALAGAWLVHRLQAEWLLIALAALAIGSGVRGLRAGVPAERDAPGVGTGLGAALGLGVGLGSGLTGTGGPVLLVPALMLLRQPLMATVVGAQAIQLPVALAATLGHAQAAPVDLRLALLLGLLLLAGSLAGQWAGRRMATRQLHTAVSLLLLATGLWLGARALL
ncbi:sulfite exporter TauE/SafE family protein [Ramlibacter rhizophilus]|uniref:Probable membrane transporter protein n=2 Tax=Ramlibacter rhizophilus TaxID=1781167 RepID=A0A4Z0BFN0_9BURK|nr:sulfite exporter TauE/SafE family protein [Ramlibacter rhizophilus]